MTSIYNASDDWVVDLVQCFPSYVALAAALAPAENLATRIRQLAGLAVDRYVASPNFTVLHMVTGLRALRTLLPWIEDSLQAQALLAHNFVAAYLAAQVKPLNAPPVVAPHHWDAVIAAAIASDDDHVVKLVQACREEAAVYGEGNYLRAATLVAGLYVAGGRLDRRPRNFQSPCRSNIFTTVA